MKIEETDYCNVSERAEALGLNSPSKLAVLPVHFENATSKGELLDESSAMTVRKLWRQAGLEITPVEKPGDRFPEVHENDFKLVMPLLFIGYSMWSENPAAVSLALNVAASYIYDFFKGVEGSKKVELDIVVEKTPKKEYRRISYKGPPGELPNLSDLVQKITKNGR